MSHRQLSISGVRVSFGQHAVLEGVDLVVPRGQRLALLGANGSGKTTLLSVLAGSVQPVAGQVRVDGQPLRFTRAGLRAHRQVVQLVAQNPDDQLFAADVFRDVSFGPLNLGLGEAEVRERVADALRVLSLEDIAEAPIHELSYGQRKRVAIAGALAMRPCVMLLDEPTAGLDPHGIAEMVEALDDLIAARTTVVMATHDVNFALGWADTVAVLVNGVVRHGPTAHLLGNERLLDAARLRQPLLLDVAARLGVAASGITDVASLIAGLQAAGIDPETSTRTRSHA